MIEAGKKYDLPAGHAYLQPAMTVTVTQVKYGEWVAYENHLCCGCSRLDYFERNAALAAS